MVRLMFNRWLLPHTQPAESARQKKNKKRAHTLASNDLVLLLNLIDKAKKILVTLPLETLDSSKENSPE